MQLYEWLSSFASNQSSGKALVYRDTYLSWRGLLHRVDRRAQELHALGIAPGAWVGLMLGNVPDFIILALALSKIDAVIVPLDPTTGNRELEMVLEAAPLRALITRPRGGEGGQATAGLPYYAGPVTSRPPAGPPSKFVPESRRRLQGTLLTCGLYKRTAQAGLSNGSGAPEVVQLTASVGRGPQGGAQDLGEPGGGGRGHSQDPRRAPRPIASSARCRCTEATASTSAFSTSLANGATLFLEDEVSPKRIAKLLREQRIDLFAGTPALFGSLVRVPTVKPLKNSGARFLSSGSRAAGHHRRGVSAALRRAAALLLSQHAGRAAGDRSRRQGSRERRAIVRGGRAAHRQRQGR